MQLSLREAARETGVSKSTILRAIQRGRLSAARDDDGNYEIDPAELFRVYAPRTEVHEVHTGPTGQGAPAVAPPDAAVLQARIEGLDAQIAMLREIVERANRRAEAAEATADSWREQAQASIRQAEASMRHAEASQRLLADQGPRRRGWFGFRKAG